MHKNVSRMSILIACVVKPLMLAVSLLQLLLCTTRCLQTSVHVLCIVFCPSVGRRFIFSNNAETERKEEKIIASTKMLYFVQRSLSKGRWMHGISNVVLCDSTATWWYVTTVVLSLWCPVYRYVSKPHPKCSITQIIRQRMPEKLEALPWTSVWTLVGRDTDVAH